MRSRHADKIWTAGGVLGAVVLLALGWFFFIGPQYAEAASLEEQRIQAEVRLTAQQRKLAELRRQNEDLPQYRAQLDRARAALPATPGTSDFLRELQTAGQEAGVSVTGLTIGGRMDVPETAGAVYAFPVALTVVGPVPALEGFLNHLQQVQPRAVLIRNANVTTDNSGTSLTLSLQIFVAPGDPAAAKSEK
jgi:Tfp pilus assembly protein PilO